MSNIRSMGPGKPPTPSLRLDINQTEAILCNNCGHSVFNEGLMLRKVPALLSPNGQESLIPIPVFECSQCGHVNKEFLPQEMNEDGPQPF